MNPDRKTEMLLHLLGSSDTNGVLVFVRTKHRADRIARQLSYAKVNAACIHGDRSQSQREAALNGFRRGAIKVLVATDIAARGLDISAVSHVINYDLPSCPEDYVHRIGRTARAGAAGNAWSMITAEDAPILREIERTVARSLARVTLPAFNYLGGSSSVGQRAGMAGYRTQSVLRTDLGERACSHAI